MNGCSPEVRRHGEPRTAFPQVSCSPATTTSDLRPAVDWAVQKRVIATRCKDQQGPEVTQKTGLKGCTSLLGVELLSEMLVMGLRNVQWQRQDVRETGRVKQGSTSG